LNTKVADLATPYHFQKGYIGFFSTDFARNSCQLSMPTHVHEQEMLTLEQVFYAFPLKI
jgi:hypothetical protein